MNDGHGEADAMKRLIGEQAWLHYYNRVLFERGLITEAERNRMDRRIDARRGPGGINCQRPIG